MQYPDIKDRQITLLEWHDYIKIVSCSIEKYFKAIMMVNAYSDIKSITYFGLPSV